MYSSPPTGFLITIFICCLQHEQKPKLLIEKASSVVLTCAEYEVRGDVKGLDLDVVHVEGDALLVIAGDEGDGLLSRAHIGVPGWGHQGREPVGAGHVLSSYRQSKRRNVLIKETWIFQIKF